MDAIFNWLESWSGTVLIIALMLMAMSKVIMSVFRAGVGFKKQFATKDEQREFEDQMRKDMRGYAKQIQDTVLTACLRTIERELREVDNIRETATKMEALKVQLEAEVKHALEKYDEVKAVAETVRTLNTKVTRIEYGHDGITDRRTDGN